MHIFHRLSICTDRYNFTHSQYVQHDLINAFVRSPLIFSLYHRQCIYSLAGIIESNHLLSNHGLCSLTGETSYRQISWSIEAVRSDVIMIASLWDLTGISTEPLPSSLPTVRVFGDVKTRIWRLRIFTRSCGKTSYRLVNRGHGFIRGVLQHTINITSFSS